MANQKVHRIGLDVGSTTAKIVMLAENGQLEYAQYERHQANPQAVVRIFLEKMSEILKDDEFTFSVTGSVGLGMAERCGLHFVQEVVAATEFTKKLHPDVTTIIDIGGEDAKIVYLSGGQVTDLRMNGNCAGGTGAFIDQMALCLGVEVSEMDNLAKNAKIIYPIASRCGVFSKTDIQNLIARNATKEDIAASIFRAVAVQTASALSHGCQVRPTVMMCGGPLTFLPSLRKAIADYFQLDIDKDILHLEHANYVPAWGTAITFDDSKRYTVGSLKTLLYESDVERDSRGIEKKKYNYTVQMPPVFKDAQDYADWQKKKSESDIKFGTLKDLNGRPAYLGIDSGSTTTKIVLTDPDGKILFRHYAHNGGNPVEAVSVGLNKLKAQAEQEGVDVKIAAGCSTGYGEDLIKAAFSLNYGMIETMAHYVAAQNICPNVSFILDIGGQDMKAIYVENGILTRMEINEACSSGCGSFIETFAQTLGCEITEFVQEACKSQTPCDLGTRCTVFMNSKVKQVLREGYSLSDISAGLAYSVVKNCLFKVLKIKNYDELGGNIVLQGGTMRNDAIVKAFENLTQRNVYRNNIPELMGAYGCALYAAEQVGKAQVDARPLDTIMQAANYELDSLQCKGCENQCQITRYKFQTGQKFYSGNKCEKIFTNGANALYKGINMSDYKYRSLFKSELAHISEPKLKIGIPQVLNMFEEFPFWKSLFEECGIQVVLSPTSTYHDYEKGVHSVMSDNICFPAKLVHSHIYELAQMKVDRIFFPRVVYERVEDENSYNSFNCPIIIGYPDVVDSAIEVDVPIDSPIVAFKNNELMLKQIVAYLKTLGVKKSTAKAAVMKAIRDWDAWGEGLRAKNTEVYNKAEKEGRMTILLAGRPYHTDPLVQHNIADMIAKM
ncbi:MAG: acyl-CoA dehydratase activase-related protein, partial [Bacteroidales bacterium]|nr:acyl-CoA dehydratase activase-related protein [Bacteroidales bacterium]